VPVGLIVVTGDKDRDRDATDLARGQCRNEIGVKGLDEAEQNARQHGGRGWGDEQAHESGGERGNRGEDERALLLHAGGEDGHGQTPDNPGGTNDGQPPKTVQSLVRPAASLSAVILAPPSGGRTMEDLVRDGYFQGVLDLTTTELADQVCGGVMSAGPDRGHAAPASGVPVVLVPGCVDMANFGAPQTVPARYAALRAADLLLNMIKDVSGSRK
jgi:hypothetical protein